MAGITALNKIRRQQAAFGGVMGKDGRKAYVGGSYSGSTSSSGEGSQGSGKGYQGGSGAAGSAESGKSVGSDGGPSYDSGTVTANDYRKAEKQFKYDVDKKKLKRPNDNKNLKNKTIPDAYSLYYTGVPKSNIPYLGNILNMTRGIRNKGLRKNIDYFLGLKSRNPNLEYEDTLQGYKDYMSDRLSGGIDAAGNVIPDTLRGNRDEPILISDTTGIMNQASGTTEEDETEEFTYRMGDGQNVGRDVTLGYAANGGRITRAGGGVMNAVPRQGYFLGKIVKGVGKAIGSVADAAGKVLKSDVGKMALLAGGAYMLGGAQFMGGKGMFTSGQGLSRFGNIGRKLLLKDGMNFGDKGALSLSKILGLSAALPFIPGINKVPENEDIGMADRGGRLIDPLTGEEGTPSSMRANIENAKIEAGGDPVKLAELNQKYNNMLFSNLPYENYGIYAANGGRIARAEGGLMNLGGMEKDYRAEGGFVPIGEYEKKDDVPARLSVNEFVFTADAVRNAGGGDIDRGAEVMENMMKNLENGGTVSEESQGNTGAQEMFSVSERIGEVI